MYEADATIWPDASCVATLHRGLCSSLHQTIENSNDSLFSLSYNDYVEQVQISDHCICQNLSVKSAQSIQPVQKHDLMNTSTHSISVACVNADDVSDALLSSESESEPRSSAFCRWSHRLANNLCLCCGSTNHWIAACPLSHSSALTSRQKPTAASARMSDTYNELCSVNSP